MAHYDDGDSDAQLQAHREAYREQRGPGGAGVSERITDEDLALVARRAGKGSLRHYEANAIVRGLAEELRTLRAQCSELPTVASKPTGDSLEAWKAYYKQLGGERARGVTPYGWFAAGWEAQERRGHYVHGQVLTVEPGEDSGLVSCEDELAGSKATVETLLRRCREERERAEAAERERARVEQERNEANTSFFWYSEHVEWLLAATDIDPHQEGEALMQALRERLTRLSQAETRLAQAERALAAIEAEATKWADEVETVGREHDAAFERWLRTRKGGKPSPLGGAGLVTAWLRKIAQRARVALSESKEADDGTE